jgi:TonB family protein
MRIPVVALGLAVASLTATRSPLTAQSRASTLIAAARVQLSANCLDSADVLLHAALDSATQRTDSVDTFVWRAVLWFMRGDESRTATAFHQALVLDSTLNVQGLDRMSPRLQSLFEEERLAIAGDLTVYVSANVDDRPRRLSGPSVRYPPDLLRRQVHGRAVVGLTVDTMGRALPASIQVLSTPDSGFVEPLRQMLLASAFSPGRLRGRAVRTMIELAIDLVPGTPPNATALVTAARAHLAAHETDSALASLRDALDPATRASEGERVYALLVRGAAWSAAGKDSLARVDYDAALAGYRHLTAAGAELAPFLKRLADSVRSARAGSRYPDALGRPLVVGRGNVDVAPVLLSHPPIIYPAELQALRIGGMVIVEATVDTAGQVVQGSVKVAQSPNPGLDAEAMRVVAASRYRPARRGTRPVAATIRQAITFTPF